LPGTSQSQKKAKSKRKQLVTPPANASRQATSTDTGGQANTVNANIKKKNPREQQLQQQRGGSNAKEDCAKDADLAEKAAASEENLKSFREVARVALTASRWRQKQRLAAKKRLADKEEEAAAAAAAAANLAEVESSTSLPTLQLGQQDRSA